MCCPCFLMTVIPETRRGHVIRYLGCYYYHWVDTFAGGIGILVPEGTSCPVVTVSSLI